MKRRPATGSIAIRYRLKSDSEAVADEPGDGGGDVSIKSLWQVIVVIGRDDARAYCGEHWSAARACTKSDGKSRIRPATAWMLHMCVWIETRSEKRSRPEYFVC